MRYDSRDPSNQRANLVIWAVVMKSGLVTFWVRECATASEYSLMVVAVGGWTPLQSTAYV